MTHRSQARQGQGLKNTFFCEVDSSGKERVLVGTELASIEDSQR